MKARTPVEGPVISYPPEAVLEIEHVAAWLRIGISTAEKLDIPCAELGTRTHRYLAADVIDYLRKKARTASAA